MSYTKPDSVQPPSWATHPWIAAGSPTPEKDALSQMLHDILAELTKDAPIPESEKNFIVSVAKEMFQKQFPEMDKATKKELTYFLKDNRDELKKILHAATAGAMLFTALDKQSLKCDKLFREYLKLKQDPKQNPEKLNEKKEELKQALLMLNALTPDPNLKKQFESLAKEGKTDEFINKMTRQLELKDKKESGDKLTPEENTENKDLADSLHSMFGMDPHTPGRLSGPVQCMMGNYTGIADNYPAYGLEPLHVLSGDLTTTGDKHRLADAAKTLDDNFDNALYHASNERPKLERS